MNAQLVPRKLYIVIWVILVFLLLLNWGLAQFDLGTFNVAATLLIAGAQMLLSILYFMHVRYHPGLVWIFVAAGFIWLLIMFDLTLSDYMTRGAVPDSYHQTWQRAEPAKPR